VAEVPLSAAGGQYVGGAVVLAAKVLTESDAKGRVILPRAMVEHNLAWFVGTYRCLTVMYTVPCPPPKFVGQLRKASRMKPIQVNCC
jgi:hypothetical protein